MPRNNFLFANAIYLLPYTGAGSGIQRALSQDKKLSFSNNESLHEFVITIERESVIVGVDLDTFQQDSDTNPNTNLDTSQQDLDTQQAVLSTSLDTSQQDLDTQQATSDTSMRIKLSNKQKDIVNYCSVPRSSKEILERVGVSNHSKNRERYVTFLVEAGYLEMTNPENPNASNQKYRKKLK